MVRYIALLRGINISGKNKISMQKLKEYFEELSFHEVKTYLNSGNVIFSTSETNISDITSSIESMIKKTFDLNIPVATGTSNLGHHLVWRLPVPACELK